MLKKMSLLLMALLLVASCSGEKPAEEATAENAAATDEVAHMTIGQFMAEGENYEGKLVEVEGTVDHVCAHSGKRMFIVGENPEDRVKIEAGDVGTFDMALQGSKVKVVAMGTVMKMDSAYLDNWASEVSAEDSPENCTEEQKEMSKGGEEHDTAMAQIIELRRQLAESEKGYLAFCSLEAKSFKEVK